MWIATKRRCCMCSTSIVSESRKPPALLIRGGGRIIIDCRRRIYWNRSIVEENMARGDRHGNREAKKKPKKLKPKEIAPISTLASIQKKALEGIVALAKNRRFLSRFGSAVSALKH
jgi:hypothetical protein